MFLKIITILLFSILRVTNSQRGSLCVLQETCGNCLTADIKCSWCSDRYYDMRKPRCMPKNELIKSNCNASTILESATFSAEIIENQETSDFSADKLDAIQLQPQKIKLKLRRSQTQTIKMTYKPAKNYPLDLYYLMDLTWSMKDDKQTLVNMGGQLATALGNLSENYRIGFGSFADKPTMPFIMPGKKYEENPCALEHDFCQPAYGYRHRLSLTKNIEQFTKQVNASAVTGNLDNLEGGLDALMQILVCKDDIGWMDKSRKIVIFASDGQMHFAGDGLLAGIIKKNDQQCHLSSDGEYMSSLNLDYPSLEEIYRQLVKSKVNVIFAVTKDILHHYDRIHGLLKEVTSVGILKLDSSNILELVDTGYKDFVRKVNFFDNSTDFIKIDYTSDCGGSYEKARLTNRCDNVDIGKQYDFYLNISLLDYPEDVERVQHIRIEESSLASEGLDIDIEILDDCPCLKSETGEQNSEICHYAGEYKCGMCICETGWIGKTCDCNMQDFSSSKELENKCREVNDSDGSQGLICSDRGECLCGECDCQFGFSGKYCQCFDCPIYDGLECGSPDRSFCNCGTCICKAGWSGERCDCPTSDLSCKAPNSMDVCSNQGTCECGQCKCNEKFYGMFCESSTDKTDENYLCAYYEPCVKCLIYRHQGVECANVTDVCSLEYNAEVNYEFHNNIDDAPIKCIVRTVDSNGKKCEHQFTYAVDISSKSHLRLQVNPCSQPNVAILSGLIFIATFFIGLAILIVYKFWTNFIDRKEYAKFEQERAVLTEYKYESPIYKSPVTTFINPKLLAEEIELEPTTPRSPIATSFPTPRTPTSPYVPSTPR